MRDLINYISIKRNLIPSHICDTVISDIEDKLWQKHEWSDGKNSTKGNDKELSVTYEHTQQELIQPSLSIAINEYELEYESGISEMCGVRFNRYKKNEVMEKHVDNIRSLFDGQHKGVPILSIVGNLNDNYEGGKLTFWNNYEVNLGKGDIIIWPSNFLYPHRVKEVIEGVRYSYVCWAW